MNASERILLQSDLKFNIYEMCDDSGIVNVIL